MRAAHTLPAPLAPNITYYYVSGQSKPHISVTTVHIHEVHRQIWMVVLIHLQKKKIVNPHLPQK